MIIIKKSVTQRLVAVCLNHILVFQELDSLKPVFQENEKSSGFENMTLNMTGSVLPGMLKKKMFDNSKIKRNKNKMNFLKLVTNSILRFIYNESEVYVGGY